MNTDSLRAFVRVAELGSFSRAAESLHLAQPAVSQQVKRLEREVGADLFHRSTRRVHVTPEGAALLPRATVILAELDRARDDVWRLSQGLAGRVSIGFVGTATYDLLPRVSRAVRAALPDVALEVHGEQLTPVLMQRLVQRDIDIAVMRDPHSVESLRVAALRSERLIAAVPTDHPGASGARLKLASLKDSPFVTYPSGDRSVTYAAVMRACRQAGFTPHDVVEVRETSTLVAFVAAGIGVALVPEPVRSLDIPGVAYRQLADVAQTTQLVVAARADDQSAAVDNVVSVIGHVSRKARKGID